MTGDTVPALAWSVRTWEDTLRAQFGLSKREAQVVIAKGVLALRPDLRADADTADAVAHLRALAARLQS